MRKLAVVAGDVVADLGTTAGCDRTTSCCRWRCESCAKLPPQFSAAVASVYPYPCRLQTIGRRDRATLRVVSPSAGAFALTPNAVDDQWIDYSTKIGIKKYEKATRALNNTFDGSSAAMTVFKADLLDHAEDCGWSNNMILSDIIHIPKATNPAEVYNIITEYSRLSNDDITAWANATLINNQQTRRRQNNHNMCKCIFHTVTDKAKEDLVLNEDKCMINDVKIAALYYKTLMTHADIDTQAKVSNVRTKLATLDAAMLRFDSNITEFNTYVKTCISTLTRHGARCEDMMDNLFRGYLVAEDNDFRKYMKDQYQQYQYGEIVLTEVELMAKARTAYQVAVDNEKWGALSEEQQSIIAMKAELSQLKDKNLKLDTKKSPKKKGKKKDENKSDDKKEQKKKSKSTDWKLVKPRSGKPHTKVVDGKTYHWCPYHNDGKGKWVIHNVSECRNNPNFSGDAQAHQAAAQSSSSASSPHTTFVDATAAAAVAALDSSDDE